MTLKIVTDSACDVPPALAEKLDITVVPVYINMGSSSYLDGVELSRRDFFTHLPTYDPYPTTSAPAVGSFTAVYEQLARDGATEILSIHIAASLSATYNAARLGAEAVTAVPVTLFDTHQITVGAGLLVQMAAEAAAAGRTAAEVVRQLSPHIANTRVFGVIDTLDALRRSGRVNWAEFGLGTLLKIKPIMMISADKIDVVARVRTHTRAVQQVLELVQAYRPFARIVVVHVNAPQAADALCQAARVLFADAGSWQQMEIGPAIGTHLGQGAVGFACIST